MSAAAGLPLLPPPLITGEYLAYNKAPTFLAIVVTLVSIALLTFLLRVYTRTRLLRFFGIDDWLMLVAVTCCVGLSGIFIRLTGLGFGKHFWTIPFQNVLRMSHLVWVSSLLYAIGMSFVKLSVAFFLLRIMQRPLYRRLLCGLIAILAILTVVWFVTLLFQCIPVEAAWDPYILHAKCMSHKTTRNIALFNSFINAATDMIFATLPIPIIWRLRVSIRTRVSLILVFSLGYIACAAAIVRMPLIYNIWNQEDIVVAWLFVWSIIEMSIGIMAACLPPLKPLLGAFKDAILEFRLSGQCSSEPQCSSSITSNRHLSSEQHGFQNFTFARPKKAYTRHQRSGKYSGLKTYHDPSSNVTFDIYDRPPRIPCTWSQHSRTPSGFSGFTNFSQPLDMSFFDIDNTQSRSRGASRGLIELESEIGRFRSGYAVSVTSGEVENALCGDDELKTSRGAACEEASLRTPGTGEEKKETGQILKTTTTEVTIS